MRMLSATVLNGTLFWVHIIISADMRRPTGDQEVAGSTPAEVGNILSWRLIMKYFLRSFYPFPPDSRRAVVSFWRKNVHNTG